MDVFGWIWWGVAKIVGLVWSIVWFLLGGWVSTIAQIAVIAMIIFGMKYGWQRAPFEIWRSASGFGRFFWGWLRARDYVAGSAGQRETVREVIRTVRVKEPGDVNLSTLLSITMIAGVALAVVTSAIR